MLLRSDNEAYSYRNVTKEVFAAFNCPETGTLFSRDVLARNLKKWVCILGKEQSCGVPKDADRIIDTLDDENAAPKLLKVKNVFVVDFILDLLWTFVPFPATNLYQVPDVANSQYKYINANMPEYRTALLHFQIDFDVMLIRDLYSHLKSQKCKPVFNEKKEYISRDESSDLIKNWLLYQFDNDRARVTDFLTRCYSILTQTCDAKLNGIWLQGPSSSGKSYTFSALAELHVMVAHIEILNDTYAFNFANCAKKKIVFMDEGVIPPSLKEMFLKLLSGTSMCVNVKNSSSQYTNRMPVILLSNTDVVDINDPVWNTRIFHTQVKTLPPNWEKREKCIFPLGWLDVFEEFGLH